ncbi:MAG: DUF3189 family protein [Bacillota bacterium]
MEIIYHCYGGTHSSVLAAALHTGVIAPHGQLPRSSRLLGLPFLDTQDGNDHGQLRFFGRDENGHRVYVLGRRRDAAALTLVLNGPAGEEPAREIILVNAMSCVPLLLRVGGYISRRLKLTWLGRPLVFCGLRRGYPCLRELVYLVKKEVAEG